MAASINTSTPVALALLPDGLDEALGEMQTGSFVTKRAQKTRNAQKRSVAILLCNLLTKTLTSIEAREPKKFDANVGDFGCQRQAFHVRRLLLQPEDFVKESTLFNNRVKPLKMRNRRVEILEEMPVISRELKYLIHCRLLTVIREPYQKTEEGIVVTRCNMSWLSKIYKRIDQVPKEYRNKIVQNSQYEASALSMEMQREEVARITLFASARITFVATRLSMEESLLYTPDVKYRPKMFGCLFYDITTVLVRLREEQGLVCLRSVELEGPPHFLVYKSEEIGAPFTQLEEDAVTQLEDGEMIVVFEGVFRLSPHEVARQVAAIGFSEVVLRDAATAPQFWPKSTLDDVPSEAGRVEITAYAEKRTEIIALDHIYTNIVRAEMRREENETT